MLNADGARMADEEIDGNLEDVVIDMCSYLTDDNHPVPEDAKPFFESEMCAEFIGAYFDLSVKSKITRVPSLPDYLNFTSWETRVSSFFKDTTSVLSNNHDESNLSVYLLKKALERKPKYAVLQFLAERQAIIDATSSYSERALNLSRLLYKCAPPQFESVLNTCKRTDKEYFASD